MKRSKILCLSLAILSLLVSLLVFSASAAGSAELEIVSKNISYDNDLKFVVAVPKAAVTDSLTFTVTADGATHDVTKTVSQLESDAINDPTINGVACYAIMSDFGVSMKDMAKEYTLTVTSGEETSEPFGYSVAEYLYERLFKNAVIDAEDGTADADRRSLYLSTLTMGASAEQVLYNRNNNPDDDVDVLVDEHLYSDIAGEAGIYKPGDKVTLTELTSVYRFEKSGDAWTKTEVVLAPGEVEVDTHMILSGKSCKVDFEDGLVSGSYLTEKNTTYTTHSVVSGDDAPALSDGKVLKVTQNTANGSHTINLDLAPVYSKDGGNIYVFDFDAYFEKPNNTSSSRYLLGINFGGATFHVNGYNTNDYKIRFFVANDAYATGYTYREWGSYRIVFEVTSTTSVRAHVYSKAATGTDFEHLYTYDGLNFSNTTGVNKISITCYNAGHTDIVPYTYYLDNLSFMRTNDADSYVPFEWSSVDSMNLVTEESGDWVNSLKTKFKQATAVTLNSATSVSGSTLIVGNVAGSISDVAYQMLQDKLDTIEKDDEEGYVIYTSGGSIAVAYTSSVARIKAINNLLALAAKTDLLTLNAGEISSDVYSLVERANTSREAMHQAQFDEIERQLEGIGRTDAAEIKANLESFFSHYDADILIWLANLYDRDEGGFYFSNSARDNVGYLPDVESTAMAFRLLDDGGMFKEFGGLKAHGIPEFMRAPMTNWLLSMQDPDGYFYHPQWGKEGSGDVRKGRDVDSVVYLLNRLGVNQTYYSVPGHPEFTAIGAPSTASAVALASPLKRGTISAVASVVAASSVTLPTYLQTPDAWTAYLEGLDINGAEKSYPVGNWLCSTVGTVREADTQWETANPGEKAVFSTIALEFLNETQYEDIGLWEYNNGTRKNDKDPDDGIGYNGTNGLMKISVAYSGYNASRTSSGLDPIPMAHPYAALQSAVKVAKYGEDPNNSETVCYLLNNWTCLSSTLNAVKTYDSENYPAARELVLSNLADMIAASETLLVDHLLDDGGFKYYENSPCNAANSTPVAFSPIPESDVNAVTVCTTSTINNIFSTMRTIVPSIPAFRLWCEEDYYIFMNELENVQPVVKSVPVPETITFDKFEPDSESTSPNVTSPDGLVYVENINDTYHSSTVVDSTHPDAEEGDKMLRLQNTLSESGGYAGSAMSAIVTFANALDDSIVDECYIFETDICIEGNWDGTPAQIYFIDPLNGKWISGFTIRTMSSSKICTIYDAYAGLDETGTTTAHSTSIASGTWFNLKMKLYKFLDAEGNLQVMTKIYVNDTFLYETDCAQFGTSNNSTDIGRVKISSYKTQNNVVCLDNIYCAKIDEAYVSGAN